MRPTARALKTAVLLAVTFLLLVHRSNDIRAQSPALTWDGLIEHVTEAPYYNAPSPDGSSYLPRHATSADGHYVAFITSSDDLVSGDIVAAAKPRNDKDPGPQLDQTVIDIRRGQTVLPEDCEKRTLVQKQVTVRVQIGSHGTQTYDSDRAAIEFRNSPWDRFAQQRSRT